MNGLAETLLRYSEVAVFAAIFGAQMGLPLSRTLVLLTAGALAGAGKLDLGLAIGLAALAALSADVIWYGLGRSRGSRVLRLLCRISLQPDACVRRTQDLFARFGVHSLLIAKFVPGAGLVTPPLAGMARVRLPRFILFDALGVLVWSAFYTGIGFRLSGELERAVADARRAGIALGTLIVGLLVAYAALRYARRAWLLRALRVGRITVDQLERKLAAGEPVVIVDLRHRLDVEAFPYTIPGAIWMAPDELDQRHEEIPRGREVVLYCT